MLVMSLKTLLLSEPWGRSDLIARWHKRNSYDKIWRLHPRVDDWFTDKLKAYDVEGTDSQYFQSPDAIIGAVLVDGFESLKHPG